MISHRFSFVGFVVFPCVLFSFWGQLHIHGYPADIGHGSIYGNRQGSLADRGFWKGESLLSE